MIRIYNKDRKEIEKRITEVELAEDIEELKEAVVRLAQCIVKAIRNGDWEEPIPIYRE